MTHTTRTRRARVALREKVFLMSLGCAKNQVDSEVMSASLLEEGFRFVADPEEAEVIILNSCSFIREAVEENLQVLESLAIYRRKGQCSCLVLAGCLVERYGRELMRQLPYVDLFLGMETVAAAGRILVALLTGTTTQTFFLRLSGSSSPGKRKCRRVPLANWAYVKISEGCSNHCAYCTLPRIRGPLRSRPRMDVLEEASSLARGGVREINLVAQDVAAYGRDRPGGKADALVRLLKELSRIRDIRWIRLLYCHPAHISESLIGLIGSSEKICPYLDLPIQHVSAQLLKGMNRHYTEEHLRLLIEKLRQARPGIALRTTVMVGFPGESEQDFERLLTFLQETRFHHLGTFIYSPERGTPSWRRRQSPSEAENRARRQAVMKLQGRISRSIQKSYLNTEQEVLIEGPLEEDPALLKCRTRFQAPEVDGTVLVPHQPAALPSIARVRITGARTYDLTAEYLRPVSG